jgi:hypothetical protein
MTTTTHLTAENLVRQPPMAVCGEGGKRASADDPHP